jgi:predicted nucleic acid-binding protein
LYAAVETAARARQNPGFAPRSMPGNDSVFPLIVLDTNVVLDWLLFDDRRMATLAAALTAGRVRWVASEPMREELCRVLLRGIATRPGQATDSIVAAFDRWSARVEPAAASLAPSLRCSDADDQKFVDLAVQMRASDLISRDRAVLRLAGAARGVGLRIVVPERWTG